MRRYLAMRTLAMIITFIGAITIVFLLSRTTGDPFLELVEQDPSTPPEVLARLRARYGLDKPLYLQYVDFILATFRGDFGHSLMFNGPVFDVIAKRLPWTIFLLFTTITISTVLSVYIGAYTAWKRGSKFDTSVNSLAIFLRATPAFWLGMIVLMVFGFYLDWFPLFGAIEAGKNYGGWLDPEFLKDVAYHAALPMGSLLLRQVGINVLYMRNATVEVLGEDFMTTARAKGCPERTMLFRHALKNSILPMVTVTALRFGFLVDGAILTETVFSYPGTGRLIFQAITNDDFFLIQGAFIMISVTVLIANFIADILYGVLDPRVKLGKRE